MNPHLITIATALVPRGRALLNQPFEQFLVPVDSQSVLRIDAHLSASNKDCLIIVHGLEGSSTSDHVLGLSYKAIAQGFNVVRVNLRNCGNTLHLTPTLYNAGQSSDLLKVSNWLLQNQGQGNQYLIGFSLGGNVVLKALAEIAGSGNMIKGGCAVSPSIDLSESVKAIGKIENCIYEYCFLRSLREKIKQKAKLFPNRFDASELERVNSLFEFDDLYTAADAGYKSAPDYYAGASSKPLLNKIKVPTLIITAQNDPIVPFVSFAEIDNVYIELVTPKKGGHVAFLLDKKDLFWMDKKILEFCAKQKGEDKSRPNE